MNKLLELYHRFLKSPLQYARHIGVTIGDNCFINTYNWGSEPYLIEIGNNVQVTQNVYFHTHGGAHVARRNCPRFDIFGKIIIKDWAYIGAGSHIMPGVTIGEGALVAAGSIVTKSIPDREVWGGTPAKFLNTVDDYLARNMKYNLNSKGLTKSEKKKLLLSLPEDNFIKK